MRSFRKKSWKLPCFGRQPLGNALRGCWTAAGKCSKGVGKPLGNAQRLLDSLWAIPKEYRKAAGKCPNACCQPIGEQAELPSGCRQNRGNFHSFPLNCHISIFIEKKSKAHWKILKSLSGSSPKYFLSHLTNFSQTQTGATVPLRTVLGHQRDMKKARTPNHYSSLFLLNAPVNNAVQTRNRNLL